MKEKRFALVYENNTKPARECRAGFTLIEVVFSFFLISIIVIMVGSVMVTIYTQSTQAYNFPNTYNAAQQVLEEKIEDVEELVNEYYTVENDISITTDPTALESLHQQQNELASRIAAEGLESSTIYIFGKNVDVYRFQTTVTEGDASSGEPTTTLTLSTGVPNTVVPERKMTFIKEATITIGGNSPLAIYDANEWTTLTLRYDYESKNEEYKRSEDIQWYISTNKKHALPYYITTTADNTVPEIYAEFPGDYQMIAGEKGSTLRMKEEYRGHFIICTVTPISTDDRYGDTAVSNPIYISGLPQLDRTVADTNTYELDIDASAVKISEADIVYYNIADPSVLDQSKELDGVSELPSGYSSTPLLVSGTAPSLIPLGVDTATNGATNSTKSRVIDTLHMSSRKKTTFSADLPDKPGSVFLVAKNTYVGSFYDPKDFVTAGGQEKGFVTYDKATRGGSWGNAPFQVLRLDFDSLSGFTMEGQFQFAELIVVSNPDDTALDTIWTYLCDKYYIEDNSPPEIEEGEDGEEGELEGGE
jgi:type II secretory pathway pseudopilin PulG